MYGDKWSADDVIARLKVAFRRLPFTPIYSPIKNRLEPAFWQLPVDGADLIMASAHYLGRESRARLQLLAYARARSRGITVTQLCREKAGPARRSIDTSAPRPRLSRLGSTVTGGPHDCQSHV